MTGSDDVEQKVERILRGYRRWRYWAPLPVLGVSWLGFVLRQPMRRFGPHLVVQLVMTLIIVAVASAWTAHIGRKRQEEARRLGAVEFYRAELARHLRGGWWFPWFFYVLGALMVALAIQEPDRAAMGLALAVVPFAFAFGLHYQFVKRPRLEREQRELAAQRG